MIGPCDIPNCDEGAIAYTDEGQPLCERHLAVAAAVEHAAGAFEDAVCGCLKTVGAAYGEGALLPAPVQQSFTNLLHARDAYRQAVETLACIELAA